MANTWLGPWVNQLSQCRLSMLALALEGGACMELRGRWDPVAGSVILWPESWDEGWFCNGYSFYPTPLRRLGLGGPILTVFSRPSVVHAAASLLCFTVVGYILLLNFTSAQLWLLVFSILFLSSFFYYSRDMEWSPVTLCICFLLYCRWDFSCFTSTILTV